MKERTKMTNLPSEERIKNFDEVACGYTVEEALNEASRCLLCKQPKCVEACPVHVNIPGFIKEIREQNFEKSFEVLYQDNILPAICGRVCPQESQCEGSCVLSLKHESVSIGALERFIGDYRLNHEINNNETIQENHIKVAVVGSGPASLSNAASMRKLGYDVTIYEALHKFGGVLQYGIPDFRLPKEIVAKEIDYLKQMGVHFVKNAIIGKSLTIKQLKEELNYQAIFIGSGAGLPSRLGIKGENYSGVFYANEFLTRVNLMKSRLFPNYDTPVHLGDTVAVIGGGNVAMDAARTAKRLGVKKVFILYRRDFDSLPARKEEILHAQEEGIEFMLLHNPVEFLGENYQLKQIKVEKMVLGELDASGRRRPIGTNEYLEIDVDSCIISIGQQPNPILKQATKDLEVDKKGRIITNQYQTSIEGVFAGGDVVTGAATVILAMGAGKDASVYMDEFIQLTNK
jgi:glutamate synthase (NADPH/NADH) small chain